MVSVLAPYFKWPLIIYINTGWIKLLRYVYLMKMILFYEWGLKNCRKKRECYRTKADPELTLFLENI